MMSFGEFSKGILRGIPQGTLRKIKDQIHTGILEQIFGVIFACLEKLLKVSLVEFTMKSLEEFSDNFWRNSWRNWEISEAIQDKYSIEYLEKRIQGLSLKKSPEEIFKDIPEGTVANLSKGILGETLERLVGGICYSWIP